MTFEFNEAQKAAAFHGKGPALVLAGPGSGKTTVITARAIRLSGEIRSPDRLLCITFTNAAADEMKARYLAGTGAGEENKDGRDEDPVTPVFSTVHSFCNGILKEYEKLTGKRYVRIEGEDSPKNKILSKIYRKYNGTEPDEAMTERIKGYMRKEGADGENKKPSGRNQIRRFSEIVREYAEVKRKNGYVDFDDMVLMAKQILTEERELSEKIRSRFDYIQVDEAQDLSRAQYDVIRLIVPAGNIFIVADDDQSIYGFRGADPGCLFDFLARYPGAARYELTQNFRSTPEIVKASSGLVSKNTKRFEKDLFTAKRPVRGSFETVSVKDAAEQAVFSKAVIESALSRGETAAVLYRNGMSSLPVRLALTAGNVNVKILGSYVIPWDVSAVREYIFGLRDAEHRAVFRIPSPYEVFKNMIRDGFAKKTEEACRLEGRDRKTVSVTLDFLRMLTRYSGSYREAVMLLDRMETLAPGTGNAAVLSTIHSSKGLEFDNVIVIDVLEGEIPGSEAAGAAVEEERRLLYVAMTRAKKKLIIIRPEKRGIRGEEDSRFIAETLGEAA